MHSSIHPSQILRIPLPGVCISVILGISIFIAYNAHAYMHAIPSNQPLLSLDQKYNAVRTQHCRVSPSFLPFPPLFDFDEATP